MADVKISDLSESTNPASTDLIEAEVSSTSKKVTLANAWTAGKSAASESATGAVELATLAEVSTGTDTARAVTPAGVKQETNLLIPKSIIDAETILYGTVDNTPAALAVAASRIVGRKSSGSISALTAAETRTVLGNAPFVVGSDADGDTWYRTGGALARLAKGSALSSYRMNSGATAPEWTAEGAYALSDSATIAINWANGPVQYVTLGGNRIITFTGPVVGRTYVLILIQDGTGSRTISSWPTISWAGGAAPTLTTTAGKTDIVTLLYANGIYYADCAKNFG